MVKKEYKVLIASATRLLEIAVDDMMNEGYMPVGGVHGSLGQGFMQSMVREREVSDEEASDE